MPPAPFPVSANRPAPTAAPSNGLGIASLVLGIASIVTAVAFVGLLIGFVGLVLGIVGLRRSKRGEATNSGVAIGGIVTSILGMIASLAMIVITVLSLLAASALLLFSVNAFDTYNECFVGADGDTAAEQECAQAFGDDVVEESPSRDDAVTDTLVEN